MFYSTKQFPSEPQINRLSDLRKFTSCGVLGFNYDKFQLGEEVRRISTIQQVLNMLSEQRCDLFPSEIETLYGGVLIGAFQMPEDVRSFRLPDLRKTFYVILAKTSPRAEQLLAQLNQAIVILQKSGQAEKFFKEYLPEGSGL